VTAYAFTVVPAVVPPAVGPVSAYDAVDPGGFDLLNYGTVPASILPLGTSIVTGYALAFSSVAPTPHPTTGQLWPRGAGES